MEILITDKPRDLRQSKTPEKLCQRRVADYVLYDGRNKMYSIVGELKSVESEAEAQNVEQMIGCSYTNHFITELARCVEVYHRSSGWFDCTEPSLCTAQRGLRNCFEPQVGCFYFQVDCFEPQVGCFEPHVG